MQLTLKCYYLFGIGLTRFRIKIKRNKDTTIDKIKLKRELHQKKGNKSTNTISKSKQ